MIKFDSENSLELFIYKHFDETGECLIDNSNYYKCISQMRLGDYGIPDLVFFSDEPDGPDGGKYLSVHVVELKNEPIKISNIAQICRYKRYFERAFDGFNIDMSFSLVVPVSVKDSGDAMWIVDQIEDVSVYEFSLNPHSGIEFEVSEGWKKTKEDFNPALKLFNLNEEDRDVALF